MRTADRIALTPNLPAQVSSLIGRERDLEEVGAMLASERLLTLTGPGGVGKTRLAVETASRALDKFPEGVWWIELAAVADAGMVGSALLQALGVRPLPGASDVDAAVGFLAARRALLVVDNCEHVVAEVARLAAALLRACPSLSILATSRVPLGIRGETRWAVAPLSLPSADGLDGLCDSDAAALFIDRARRIDRWWPLNDDSAWAIAEICRQLDGMPLALELAAARVAVLAPETIAHELEDALGLLAARSPTAEARHQTLRASLDWSHGLLPADARIVLRRLGVFAGGTSLELAREVCAGDEPAAAHVLAALETLVEHSLVQIDAHGTSVRYRMLETVRQYALERLADAGEGEHVRDRHRDALLAFAERQRREALTPRQPEAFLALDPEAANLAAALDRALETAPDKALRMCLALDFWYRARARFREADEAYARTLALAQPAPALRARALASWAWIVVNKGELPRASALALEAAELAEASGDDGAIAMTLMVLANHGVFTEPIAAQGVLQRCRDLARAVGDEYVLGRSEALLRGAVWAQQDEQACRADFEPLQARLEALGDRETLAWFWFSQGSLLYPLGAHEAAAEMLTRAIAVAAEINEATADRAAGMYLALIEVAAGRAAPALEQMLRIRAQTLLHGGSFALPWIELLVAQAEAAGDRLEAARARLTSLVAIQAWGVVHALTWAHAELAEVLRLLGKEDEAAHHGGLALEQAGRLGNDWLAAKTQLTLGRLTAHGGQWAEAERLHHDALAAICEHRYRLELAAALEALAQVAAGLESHIEAARILGAAERARRELGFVAWPAQRAELATLTNRLGDVLGRPALSQALGDGAALEQAEAVAWLRRARGTRRRPGHGWESLTPAEVEVVRQAAAGLTNPEIAKRLFVAPATVKTHLSHIYAKLGVRNRSQLASDAVGRLAPPNQPGGAPI